MSIPKLKLKKGVVYTIDYSDFENFVKEVYSCPDYSFCAIEEASNNSVYKFYVTEHSVINEYDLQEFEKIKSGKISSNHCLFHCLVCDKYLEPGVYVIEVCW